MLIVLWYKDGYGKPIYSFDLRDDSPESEGLLWANEDGGDIPECQSTTQRCTDQALIVNMSN